jgi:pimeloyl-ACP methyl ester carboxylesterase
MPKVKVNDIQVYYEVKGEGFPLVMIAGLGGNVNSLDPLRVEGLVKRFKVVMFDNRGAGRTDVSDKEYTIKLFADDTAGLLNALGISRAHIVGGSMGGMIAQELVLSHPDKVAKLVLLSTSCGGSKSVQMSKEAASLLNAGTGVSSREDFNRSFLPTVLTPEFVKEHPDFVDSLFQRVRKNPISLDGYMRQLNAVRNFDTYERLHNIKVPTLILQGRKDVLVPPENGSILAKAIPNAGLVYFEKSAHMLAEEVSEVIKVITEFLF